MMIGRRSNLNGLCHALCDSLPGFIAGNCCVLKKHVIQLTLILFLVVTLPDAANACRCGVRIHDGDMGTRLAIAAADIDRTATFITCPPPGIRSIAEESVVIVSMFPSKGLLS